jgi:hypothetical protein
MEDELPGLVFVRPRQGFPELTRFVLVRLGAPGNGDGDGDGDDQGLLYELRSLEQPEVRFLVAVPTPFFPDYTIELDETACTELDLHDADDALVLVVLTVDPEAGVRPLTCWHRSSSTPERGMPRRSSCPAATGRFAPQSPSRPGVGPWLRSGAHGGSPPCSFSPVVPARAS